MHLVRLFLDMAVVLGLAALVAQAFLMAVEQDVIGLDATGYLVAPHHVHGLG